MPRDLIPPKSTRSQVPRGLGIEHIATSATSDIVESSRIPKAQPGYSFQVEQLETALRQSEAENKRLNGQLRDSKARHQQAVNVQVNLEEEITSRDRRIEELEGEIRIVKSRAHQTESELAEQTAEFMNSQSRWIKNVSQLNDEIAALKAKFAESQTQLAEALKREKEAAKAQKHLPKATMKEKKHSDENIRNPASELERHQTDLLIKELLSRNQQLNDEVAHAQEVNSRLQEENENFQVLVAKRVVSGGFSLADDFADSSSSHSIISQGNEDSSMDTETVTTTSPRSFSEATSSSSFHVTKVAESGSPRMASSPEPPSPGTKRPEEAQVQALRFEVTSLNNYNRALRTSLERLVHRLLVEHNGTFAKAVEDSVSSRSLNRFNTRIASSYEIPVLVPSRSGSFSGTDRDRSSAAAVLSQMMVNKQFTGNSNRRVISVGVDNEVRRAAPVSTQPHTPRNTPPRKSFSGNAPIVFASPSVRTARVSVPSSPNLDDDVVIELPKRTDAQTQLRRLHIKDV